MKSRSQSGQDLFVHAILGGKRGGTFVDVGCSHPIELSNTYALETELDWRGVLIDCDLNATEMCRAKRLSKVICGDATKIEWAPILAPFGGVMDYASVDIDEWTNAALRNLLRAGTRFRVMTVEHDFYSRGDRLRIPNRSLMAQNGYELICGDIKSVNCIYEDWYVRPEIADMNVAHKFRSAGMSWQEALKQGGVEI